jgi:hypothetical protein
MMLGVAMNHIRKTACLAVALCAMAPVASSAQRPGEITFYSQIGFRGQSYTATGPREYARVPFKVRSARVAQGASWQVCPSTGYRGNCNTVRSSQANIAWTVNSVRPVATPVPLPQPVPPGHTGQSLRGMSAEFFPRPTAGSGRVLSCKSGAASCAAEAADRFCRSQGWTASSYERQETVSGRIYLADVLCTRTR